MRSEVLSEMRRLGPVTMPAACRTLATVAGVTLYWVASRLAEVPVRYAAVMASTSYGRSLVPRGVMRSSRIVSPSAVEALGDSAADAGSVRLRAEGAVPLPGDWRAGRTGAKGYADVGGMSTLPGRSRQASAADRFFHAASRAVVGICSAARTVRYWSVWSTRQLAPVV